MGEARLDVPPFEMLSESRATEVELVTVGLRKLNSRSCKKTVSFPMSL